MITAIILTTAFVLFYLFVLKIISALAEIQHHKDTDGKE